MKRQQIKGTPEQLATLAEECEMLGRYSEIVGDTLYIYNNEPRREKKKGGEQVKAEKWTKRERDFGYARKR